MTDSTPQRPMRRRDDADPVIDVLLCEFLPGDAGRRKTPPDFTEAILKKLDAPPADEAPVMVDDSDAIVDSLLREFVPDPPKRSSPPDLTASILERLAASEHDVAEPGVDHDPVIDSLLPEFVPAEPRNRSVPPDLAGNIITQLSDSKATSVAAPALAAHSSLPVARIVSVLVAVAASVIGVVWFAPWGDDDNGVAVNQNESRVVVGGDSDPSGPFAEDPDSPGVVPRLAQSEQPDPGTTPQPERTEPLHGIPLESPSLALTPDRDAAADSIGPAEPTTGQPSLPIAVVAAKGAATARSYWNNLGIEPTPDAAPEEIATRLKSRLGIDLSGMSFSDPERLREVLAQDTNADKIAKHWLALATGNRVADVARPENSDLVHELAKGIVGDAPLDATLVSLIDGSGANSAKWYDMIGRGGTEGIAKHLAGISFNADLRCVRCHDSHIGRSGTQDDYWSFVALVRNVVRREDSKWVVSEEPRPVNTFFELLDGRQRLAAPKVSGYLLQSDEQILDFRRWTATLAGSDALAGSLVDTLWKLVHGRPLKPSPVDAFAPPYDGSLDELHEMLAADLKANRFDLARTLALIIASPMSTRSVPEALRGNAVLTTSDSQRSEALQLVSAFAASLETPQVGFQRRVDVAMRRIGGRLLTGDDQGTLLAQPLTGNPRGPNVRPRSVDPVVSLDEKLSVDFPAEDASLPVSWLRTIDDYDLQVQHLVYLSGRDQMPGEIRDAAARLKAAGSRESALSRIWWILRD